MALGKMSAALSTYIQQTDAAGTKSTSFVSLSIMLC